MRGTICFFVLVPLSLLARGAEPSPRPLPVVAVEKLVEQLGSSDFQARQAATDALEARGSEALPALRKAEKHADPEIRRRVAELIPALEKAVALMPKRVSLHLTNRSLQDAVAEIAKQTGYKLHLHQAGGDRDKHVYSFDFNNLTFWEAIDKLSAAGDLTYQNSNNEVVQLMHQDTFSPFVHRAGPFRLVATGFQYSRGVDFSQVSRTAMDPGQRHESLSFNFTIATEPKLPLLGVGEVKLLAAYDDQNRSMLPLVEANDNVGEAMVWGGGAVFFNTGDIGGNGRNFLMGTQANLVRPTRASKSAKVIKGTVLVTLLMDQRPEIMIGDVLKAKGKKVASGKYTWLTEDIGEVAGGNKAYRIKFSLTDETKKNANDTNWINTFYQRIELQDAKGNKYQMQGNQFDNATATNLRGEVVFGDPGNGKIGPPAKLVYYHWISVQHAVSFEFRNLPLP
jgi:hypothetical protein